jgi:hypothetical protein
MTTTLAHMLRALWLALTRTPQIALLSYELWELQAWMADIRSDYLLNALDDSQHLRECRYREQEIIAQIAALQPTRRLT